MKACFNTQKSTHRIDWTDFILAVQQRVDMGHPNASPLVLGVAAEQCVVGVASVPVLLCKAAGEAVPLVPGPGTPC